MDYNWREDIIDVIDNYDIPNDTKDELFYRAAERHVEQFASDYAGRNIDECIMEEMSSIINMFAIPLDSPLYDLLIEWHDGYDEMMSKVTSSFEDDENLYFVGGANYDIYDGDLLGGTGSGEAKAAFEEFVRNHE